MVTISANFLLYDHNLYNPTCSNTNSRYLALHSHLVVVHPLGLLIASNSSALRTQLRLLLFLYETIASQHIQENTNIIHVSKTCDITSIVSNHQYRLRSKLSLTEKPDVMANPPLSLGYGYGIVLGLGFAYTFGVYLQSPSF